MKLLKRVERAERRAAGAAGEAGKLGLLWCTLDGPAVVLADLGPGQYCAQDLCLEGPCGEGAVLGWLRQRVTLDGEDVGNVYRLGGDGVRWRDVVGRVLEVRGPRVIYQVDRSDSSAAG
jgi:hypothetical protein